MKPSTIFNLLLATFAGLVCAATSLFVYLTYMERPYLSYTQLPFRVMTKEVKAGSPVLMTVVRCNADNKTRVYMLSHILMPTDRIKLHPLILQASATSIAPGCSEFVSTVNVVPLGTLPGEYHIEGFAEISGTIRTFSVGWVSEPFNVVP